MSTITPLLSMPIFRAFDSANLPLAGGLLYSYAAGTSAPLSTYSDSAGASPNANPTVLDSTGTATIRLGPASYKFVLKDSGGTTQWTIDNYVPGQGQKTNFITRRATSNQTLIASTINTLIFNTEDQDTASAFDSTTGIFTAPADGVYVFCLNQFLQNNASGAYTVNGLYLSKNNVDATGASRIDLNMQAVSGGTYGAAGNKILGGGSGMFQLSATDTVRAKFDLGALGSGTGAMVMNIGSTFSGYLLG